MSYIKSKSVIHIWNIYVGTLFTLLDDVQPFSDIGMCCSFNMKAADDIYIKNTFTNHLQKMQDQETDCN
jgi:hypothetical protein